MIIIITGPSHVGKTFLAQKLMEKYNYPYLSIDHLKMGLIRSKNTKLTPLSSNEALTNYLWKIVKEIIKTAIENKQNLIIEGVYIPLNYKKYFSSYYLNEITFYCLVYSKNYIINNFNLIEENENAIENRLTHDYSINEAIKDNNSYLKRLKKYNIDYILIEDDYLKTLNNYFKLNLK